MEVHQILPALSYGDAVSNDVIEIQRFLSEHGYSSKIFAKYIHPKVSKFASQLSSYKGSPQNVVMYHFSLAGGDVTEYVKQLPDKKVLIYHNITPPEFFDGYDDELRCSCKQGLEELKGLKNHFQLAIGDSEYNQQCLEQFGYSNTGVIPILIDTDSWSKDIDPDDLDRTYENCTINILFVGRVAPNKKHEDIIKIFYYYHHGINSNSKLYLVGSKQISRYLSSLEELIAKLGLSDAVVFTGVVSEAELVQYYRMAHVFLCMSEHEGFCVPLLEAMHFRIPIIAYNSTGVPDTLGDAGIHVNEKDYIGVAELINILIEDNNIRHKIVQKQAGRLKYFDKNRTGNRLIKIIESLEG